MSTLTELRDIRIEKLNKLKKAGINPYPAESQKDFPNKKIVDDYSSFEGKNVTLAGRIMSWREHGSIVFADLRDESGKIQLYIKEDTLEKTDIKNQTLGFNDLKLLDVGDFIQATGEVSKTQRGEISLSVKKIKILSKSLRPLPEKWEGLKDIEERYRKRYLDLLTNQEVKKVIDTRWKIEEETRKFLWKQGFSEVETPVMQPLYGGTNARPFTTHFNALNCDFYLRVAPELYLKRLIIGGYEKVFEIARNFRNEGIDHSHFPEFTMLEWYEAYADYHRVMDLAESLVKHLVKALTGGTKIKVGNETIELGEKWRRVPVEDLVKEYLEIDWEKASDTEAKKLQEKHGIAVKGVWTKNKALYSIYDHIITKKLKEPTWVLDYPMDVSPLAKNHRKKPERAERFEGYIGGVEIFDGWTEINSGLEQRERFDNEQKNMKEGDTEAMPLDEEFIEALEYGCPPLGGIGFGIDRLTMFLTNVWTMKDVVAFPTLKPKDGKNP